MKRLILTALALLLSLSMALAQEPCTADFDCNGTVDAADVTTFLSQFGRNPFNDPCPDCYDSPCPCSTGSTCEGTLSPLGRWCDQGDGTVKDMTTGLVWLKKADWGGQQPFWADYAVQDAHRRAAYVWDEFPYNVDSGLSDGSVEGDWRLPNKSELYGISVGTEYIRSSQMYFFTGVQPYYYWSSSYPYYSGFAWCAHIGDGYVDYWSRTSNLYVWPVRGGH